MGIEIERKFLVNSNLLPMVPSEVRIIQAYIGTGPLAVTRVRISDDGFGDGPTAVLCTKVKCAANEVGPLVNFVYVVEIPISEAEMIISRSPWVVKKSRYPIYVHGKLWEVDIFDSPRRGLILAEVELASENEEVVLPKWVTFEVTNDKSYSNFAIAQCKI